MNIRDLLREDLDDLEEDTPMRPLDVLAAELGLPLERLVKLDANENLYGAHPEVVRAIHEAPFHIYPDPGQQALRESIAGFVGAAPEQVVAGTGADDLIDILVRLVLPSSVVIPTPAFGMYRFLAKVSRVTPVKCASLSPRRPRPGNISSPFVYSWLTTSRPCSELPSIGK